MTKGRFKGLINGRMGLPIPLPCMVDFDGLVEVGIKGGEISLLSCLTDHISNFFIYDKSTIRKC